MHDLLQNNASVYQDNYFCLSLLKYLLLYTFEEVVQRLYKQQKIVKNNLISYQARMVFKKSKYWL